MASPIVPSPNAFTSTFLQRLGERDEPPAAGEADAAGPWHVEESPGEGFGLFRLGESRERGFRPAAVFRRRFLALLAAAVLPGTGRDAAFRLAKEAGPAGFAIEAGNGGEVVEPDRLPPRGGEPRALPRVARGLPGGGRPGGAGAGRGDPGRAGLVDLCRGGPAWPPLQRRFPASKSSP